MKIDGNGCKIKGAGSNLIGINSIKAPGYARDVIEDSTLDNVNASTAILATLKKYNAATFNIDFKNLAQVNTETSNQLWTITFPASVGTLVFWGQVSAIGDADFANGSSPSVDVTITLTNRNGTGEETAPVLTLA